MGQRPWASARKGPEEGPYISFVIDLIYLNDQLFD